VIKIISNLDKSLQELSQMVIDHDLMYLDGSMIIYLNSYIIQKIEAVDVVLSVALDNLIPVGVCLITQHNQVMAFVVNSHRKLGIGTQLVNEAKRLSGESGPTLYAYPGKDFETNRRFWI
jgi:hypothetical protein